MAQVSLQYSTVGLTFYTAWKTRRQSLNLCRAAQILADATDSKPSSFDIRHVSQATKLLGYWESPSSSTGSSKESVFGLFAPKHTQHAHLPSRFPFFRNIVWVPVHDRIALDKIPLHSFFTTWTQINFCWLSSQFIGSHHHVLVFWFIFWPFLCIAEWIARIHHGAGCKLTNLHKFLKRYCRFS